MRWAFNTHWHPDHTGGNEKLKGAGTEILAHENTRLWMGTQILSRWDGARYEPRPRAAWPTRTFYTTQRVDTGDEILECGYLLQAHTDGDIYVKLTRSNVLVTGDVFTVGSLSGAGPGHARLDRRRDHGHRPAAEALRCRHPRRCPAPER